MQAQESIAYPGQRNLPKFLFAVGLTGLASREAFLFQHLQLRPPRTPDPLSTAYMIFATPIPALIVFAGWLRIKKMTTQGELSSNATMYVKMLLGLLVMITYGVIMSS
jgi:TRAP-type mannitol/chloroaromatic compound transport system permease small subunit